MSAIPATNVQRSGGDVPPQWLRSQNVSRDEWFVMRMLMIGEHTTMNASIDQRRMTVNEIITPTFHMKANEVVRFRLYALAVQALSVVIYDDKNQTVDFWSIAIDGVTLAKPVKKDRVVPNWGQREEILVQLPREGTYRIISDMNNDHWCFHDCFCQIGDSMHHASIEVKGSAAPSPIDVSNIKLQGVAPKAIAQEEIVITRTIAYSTTHDRLTGPFPQYKINDHYYTETGFDFTVKNGTAEEWVITNPDNLDHTFHAHMIHFQVKEIGSSKQVDTPNFKEHMDVGPPSMWRDTVGVPPNGFVKIWIRFDSGIGKSVFHCHFLGHEDGGMMKNFIVEE